MKKDANKGSSVVLGYDAVLNMSCRGLKVKQQLLDQGEEVILKAVQSLFGYSMIIAVWCF